MDRYVIEDLIQKSEYVEWKNKERINHYAVMSKTGFTADAKRFAEKNGVHTFTLSQCFESGFNISRINGAVYEINSPSLLWS